MCLLKRLSAVCDAVAEYKILLKASVATMLEEVEPRRDRRVLRFKVAALIGNPRPAAVEPLPGYADRYRLRHGRFRIVYHVDDRRKEVTIVSVGYRTR
jgi:mRNA-degrading endonuclease RelE of RelBE toxin-antitoxin system